MEVLAGGRPQSGRARQVARSREELLGLLADFSGGDSGESGRELSFSDLVVVDTSKPSPTSRGGGGDRAVTTAAVENGMGRSSLPASSSPSSEMQEAAAAASKQQQQAAARERRLRRRRSDSRGSCGGSGDGVLLNFYVPGLLTRSMTAPRPAARGTLPGAAAAAPATAAAAGKARMDAPLAVGCWPALWGGGGRDRRKPAKPAAGRRDTRVTV